MSDVELCNQDKADLLANSIIQGLERTNSLSKDVLKKLSKNINRYVDKNYAYKSYNIPPDLRTFESIEEAKDFINSIRSRKYHLYFKLLLWTGRRKGEIERITKADFDFKNEDLYVTITKTGVRRIRVPLPSKLCKEFKDLFECGYLSDTPFIDCRTSAKKVFRNLCRKKGGKYNETYGTSKSNRKLYFYNIVCFRKWYLTMIVDSEKSDLIGALHNTERVARKHYLSNIGRIRRILNELY